MAKGKSGWPKGGRRLKWNREQTKRLRRSRKGKGSGRLSAGSGQIPSEVRRALEKPQGKEPPLMKLTKIGVLWVPEKISSQALSQLRRTGRANFGPYACALDRSRSAGDVVCFLGYKQNGTWIATVKIDLKAKTIQNVSD